MAGWKLVTLTLIVMTGARRDPSQGSWESLDHGHVTFSTDLGQEIHPNRHRHHQHDIYIAGFFPTSPGYAETSIGM